MNFPNVWLADKDGNDGQINIQKYATENTRKASNLKPLKHEMKNGKTPASL